MALEMDLPVAVGKTPDCLAVSPPPPKLLEMDSNYGISIDHLADTGKRCVV